MVIKCWEWQLMINDAWWIECLMINNGYCRMIDDGDIMVNHAYLFIVVWLMRIVSWWYWLVMVHHGDVQWSLPMAFTNRERNQFRVEPSITDTGCTDAGKHHYITQLVDQCGSPSPPVVQDLLWISSSCRRCTSQHKAPPETIDGVQEHWAAFGCYSDGPAFKAPSMWLLFLGEFLPVYPSFGASRFRKGSIMSDLFWRCQWTGGQLDSTVRWECRQLRCMSTWFCLSEARSVSHLDGTAAMQCWEIRPSKSGNNRNNSNCWWIAVHFGNMASRCREHGVEWCSLDV